MKANKFRISKRNLASIPSVIAEQISAIAADYNTSNGGIKSFTYRKYSAPYSLYHCEGDRYTYIYNDRVMSVEMVSGDTLGGSGLRHEIGACVPMPEGTTIIRVWYTYSVAGYAMDVINVGGDLMLSGA